MRPHPTLNPLCNRKSLRMNLYVNTYINMYTHLICDVESGVGKKYEMNTYFMNANLDFDPKTLAG